MWAVAGLFAKAISKGLWRISMTNAERRSLSQINSRLELLRIGAILARYGLDDDELEFVLTVGLRGNADSRSTAA